MNKLHSYHNEHFGSLRGFITEDGSLWFVAADVCAALAINNVSQTVSYLDDDEKMAITIHEGHSGQRGGAQTVNVISEAGLYSLLLRSRKPEAKAFKRWVTHEVIPSIRKTGQYTNPQAEQSAAPAIQGDDLIDILTYVSILRQMARMKIYPELMRAAFLAEAAGLLSGCPPERFMTPEQLFCCPFH